jgi:hypothetical protein
VSVIKFITENRSYHLSSVLVEFLTQKGKRFIIICACPVKFTNYLTGIRLCSPSGIPFHGSLQGIPPGIGMYCAAVDADVV